MSAALAARLAYVDRRPDCVAITLRGGGHVVDHGDRLLTKSGCDEEITASIDLALSRGWKTLILTGTDEFKARAWLEASRRDGLAISGYKPSTELLLLAKEQKASDELIKVERERLARARARSAQNNSPKLRFRN